MLHFLPHLAFFSVLTLALAFWQRERVKAREQTRLEDRLRSLTRETPDTQESLLQDEKTYSEIPKLNALLAHVRLIPDLDRLVLHAGFRIRAGEVVLWMGLVGMLAAFVVFALWGSLTSAAAAFALVGPGLPLAWLRRCRNVRRHTIMMQLPDSLEMVRSSLQAGHSLNQALEIVADESPDPISSEFRQVIEELKLGHSMKSALQGIYERTGIEDLRFFTVAILLNREVGGNLSEIIDIVAGTLRERFKLKGQVRALTAQGRFSAVILTALSPALVFALWILNPEYLQPLFFTRMGRLMLLYCSVSTLFGYWLMRRIVDIKVIRTD